MELAIVLCVVLGSLFVHSLAQRLGVQPAILILVIACAVSFIPELPRVQLAPEVILGVVTPPLLYSAVLHFSPFGFMRNIRSILSLGVGLVALTTVLAGLVSVWMLPALGLAGAFTLGARGVAS